MELDYMSTVNALHQDLFRNYQPSLAPLHSRGSFNYTFVEKFSASITFAKLTGVNERSMEFSVVLGMILLWSDPRLSWNPARYGDISHLYLTLDQVWFPNFHPCTSSSIIHLTQDNNQVVKVLSDGTARTRQQMQVTYSCSFDTSLFPFDTQQCSICFALNGYDPNDYLVKATIDANALDNDMTEWRVRISNDTETELFCSDDICVTIISYAIVLARNPQFWIGLVIIPIFMLGFLIFIGLFFSGPENLVNNAIGFGLTTMMSMMVVVGILNDSLSKIKSIPCMGLFVLIQISVTSVAVVSVLLTDKMRRWISITAREKKHDSSKLWRFARTLTKEDNILRNFLFLLFSVLHIANFGWFLSNQK